MNASWTSKKSRTKKSRVAAGGSDDYLSNIHENVLSHVFSRIPLDDAVRTSVLSKDWKYKWMSLYKLDIEYRHWDVNPQSVVNFLNRTLPSIECLRIFRFRSSHFEPEINDFNRWVSAALEHNLEVLILEAYGFYSLPGSLLNSTSFRQLECLMGTSTMKVDAKNIAPNLTHLHLLGVKIICRNTCPFTHYIHVFARTCQQQQQQCWSLRQQVAPKITLLHYRNAPEKIKVNPSPSSVVSAYISGTHHFTYRPDMYTRKEVGYRVRKLLNKCTSLEELFLNASFIKESRIALPLCFHKLRRLTLCRITIPRLLFELLHAAPSLKFLGINVSQCRAYNYKVKSVPACIESHLEEVVLGGLTFMSTAPEYYLAKFLLKNAAQLKNFRIGFMLRHTQKEQENVINRLSTMSTCSTSPTFDVIRWGDFVRDKPTMPLI